MLVKDPQRTVANLITERDHLAEMDNYSIWEYIAMSKEEKHQKLMNSRRLAHVCGMIDLLISLYPQYFLGNNSTGIHQ